MKYEATFEMYGVVISFNQMTSSYKSYGWLKIKTNSKNNVSESVFIPVDLLNKIAEADIGRAIHVTGSIDKYYKHNEYNTVYRVKKIEFIEENIK